MCLDVGQQYFDVQLILCYRRWCLFALRLCIFATVVKVDASLSMHYVVRV